MIDADHAVIAAEHVLKTLKSLHAALAANDANLDWCRKLTNAIHFQNEITTMLKSHPNA